MKNVTICTAKTLISKQTAHTIKVCDKGKRSPEWSQQRIGGVGEAEEPVAEEVELNVSYCFDDGGPVDPPPFAR